MSLKLPRNWDFSALRTDTSRIARSKSVMPGEGSPDSGSGSPGASRSMERPLKAGWLKRQHRSLVKNWQQRYFVLRGTTLTYHKDDREGAIQGKIQLKFSRVNELPMNTEDPGKFIFEIIPRNNGDSPHVFMANSQADMEDWVRSLRRVIGVPSSGVFGKSLSDTVTYEQRFGTHMVPILVQKSVEFIKEHGLNEEGIFRLPGQDNTVKQFRDAFDAGERPSFPSDTDVHTVASLLKLYLRELPEPVVPWTQYQDFLDCTSQLDPNSERGRDDLEKQIALLPRANYNLLCYICRFLFEVQLHSNVNKMSVENLATVMGINLLKPQIEDPITVMKATPQIQRLMTVLIRQHEVLFPPSKDVVPSRPSSKPRNKKTNMPRNFVGWESTEQLGDASLSESRDEDDDDDDDDSPGSGEGESSPIPTTPDLPSSSKTLISESPRKRTQTLPTFNCPLVGVAAKADALNRWSRIQEGIEEKTGTLSEDIFKILDLHKATIFGNLQKTSKEGGGNLLAGTDEVAASSVDNSPKHDSVSQPTQSPPQTLEPVRVPVLVPRSDFKTEDQDSSQHHSQLIESLQQRNRNLTATVAELQAALEAERRRVADLETCLKNAESNWDEALQRNKELDRELQALLMKKPRATS